MTKKYLMEFEEDSMLMADKAVEIMKPIYSSRRHFIEMATREKAQQIIDEHSDNK